MLGEIEKGNVHNAFVYAATALQADRECLFTALMQNGAVSIPDTIGHSISCFFLVLDELLAVDHPAAGTSLLSLIMYLCRFRNARSSTVEAKSLDEADKNRLLEQAASETTIVDIHQMITFYTLQAWETASWNQASTPPWQRLTEWVADKAVDETRQARAAAEKSVAAPESYEAWQQVVEGQNREAIIDSAFAILEDSYEKACDWFFRIYAEAYTPDWDPHYFTSLYSAFELSRDASIAPRASRMALIQALEYFLNNHA